MKLAGAPVELLVSRAGTATLTLGFVVSLIVVLLLAVSDLPAASLVVPLLPVAAIAMGVLFRYPLANLAILLSSVVLVLTQRDGLHLADFVFVGYFAIFAAVWFGSRLYRGEQILRRPEDGALALFLIGIVLSLPLTVLFGGDLGAAVAQLVVLSVFWLYFPIREACVRYRHGTAVMLAVLIWVVGFAAIRNLFQYQEMVLTAEHMWQYTSARVYVNDSLMMAGSVVSLVMTLFATRKRELALFGFIHVCSFIALVMTQSRGFWVAFLVGAVFIFFIVGRGQRVRLVSLAAVVGIVGGSVALLFFSDLLPIVIAGLSDRFGSLGTAATMDISLVNRFIESRAVWEHVKMNPVIGYGMAVPFSFYDITWNATMTGTFIHSGYLSLWYRFGIWGLTFVLFFWARSAWSGIVAFRLREARTPLRAAGLAAGAVLVAYVLPAQTSNPFVLIDSIFLLTALTGVAAGARARAELESAESRLEVDDEA